MSLFEDGQRTPEKQEFVTLETSVALEKNLKSCLTGLVQHLFGNGGDRLSCFSKLLAAFDC